MVLQKRWFRALKVAVLQCESGTFRARNRHFQSVKLPILQSDKRGPVAHVNNIHSPSISFCHSRVMFSGL